MTENTPLHKDLLYTGGKLRTTVPPFVHAFYVRYVKSSLSSNYKSFEKSYKEFDQSSDSKVYKRYTYAETMSILLATGGIVPSKNQPSTELSFGGEFYLNFSGKFFVFPNTDLGLLAKHIIDVMPTSRQLYRTTIADIKKECDLGCRTDKDIDDALLEMYNRGYIVLLDDDKEIEPQVDEKPVQKIG